MLRKRFSKFFYLLAGITITAIVYLPIPYADIDLLNTTFLIKWIGFGILASIIGVLLTRSKAKEAALFLTLGYLIGVLMKVAVDSIEDSTNHNLLPFELLFTVITISPTTFLAAYLVSVFQTDEIKETD